MEQGTAEWLAARCGKATASEFAAVMAKIKTGEAATRRDYRIKLVTERLTGEPASTFNGNKATEWGKLNEADARSAYEAHSGNIVVEVGFVEHPTVPMCGSSPDGLIDEDGGCEIKCPFSSIVHVETLLNGKMPPEHKAQVQGNLWVTGRRWWDFVSFDPRMPEHLRLFVQRIERDEEYIKALDEEVRKFNNEVAELTATLMQRR